MKTIIHLIAFWLATPLCFASIPLEGTFLADKSCPAYLSKNHKTNPDQITLTPNQRYPLKEANQPGHPQWYRIDVGIEKNALRWVARDCGQVSASQPVNDCHLKPGYADAYVLALSWQPGFCQVYGYEQGKPECYRLNDASYASSHLSLHGLWPNQKACGTHYGYCQTNKRAHHCDYPQMTFSQTVAIELTEVMPSFAAGSCLERHEWNRHGTCQLRDADAYFDLASKLTRRFDKTRFSSLLRQYSGGYVSITELKRAFREDFGDHASEKLYLGCQSGMLVDVWLSLPAQLSESQSLTELVDQAPKMTRKSRCPHQVYISDFAS